MRAINLEEKWTTDLIAEIKWRAIWIECKKDKEEYDFWIKLEKRLNEEWKLPKSYHREEAQIREKRKLERRWSIYILTYSSFLEYFTCYKFNINDGLVIAIKSIKIVLLYV